MPVEPCIAICVGDQMACAPCGLVWDLSDENPPVCPRSNLCAVCRQALQKPEIDFFKSKPEQHPAVCAPCYRKTR